MKKALLAIVTLLTALTLTLPLTPGKTSAHTGPGITRMRGGERWPLRTAQMKRRRFNRPETREWWRRLPPERKRRIIERYRRWKNLPPQVRRRILRKYRKFRNLPPEKKRRLLRRWKKLRKLPPGQRKKVLEFARRFRQLPPEKKKVFRESLRSLRD
ncbi:MAG: DUF3106 domain-containing protein, partial [Deltaproteobacteria bacterium]